MSRLRPSAGTLGATLRPESALSPSHGGVSGRLIGGVVAGAVGTAAMTTTARLHREHYARRRGLHAAEVDVILDYDDSDHVVRAAGTVLRALGLPEPEGPRGRRVLFDAVHWGYGSGVGAAHAVLRHRLGEPAAALAFLVGCQAMALSLFPVLGGTPPPWRWRRRLLVTSIAQHTVYAGAVAAAAAAGRRRHRR